MPRVRFAVASTVLWFVVALAPRRSAAVGPDDPEPTFARQFCADPVPGGMVYYPNGEIRADINCQHDIHGYVYYATAKFYNEQGKLSRSERMDRGYDRHSVQIYDYTPDGERPSRIRGYDGDGKLISDENVGEGGFIKEIKDGTVMITQNIWDRSRATFEKTRLTADGYASICRDHAGEWQMSETMVSAAPEFDVEKACACVGRLLAEDEAKNPGRGPSTAEDRVGDRALRSANDCLCPNAFAGSALKKACAAQ
jgi:hypothetical protein